MKENPISRNWNLQFISVTELFPINNSSSELPSFGKALHT